MKKRKEGPKHCIKVQTYYGFIEIINLRRVWVSGHIGTIRLMYQDDIYEYNCIYWSHNKNVRAYYQILKQKLIEAYNSGDSIVEL